MSQRENEQDRDARKREFAKQLLDSYFMFRQNLPGEGYIQENKTTLQIMDELTPMMMLPTNDVVGYMWVDSISWNTWMTTSIVSPPSRMVPLCGPSGGRRKQTETHFFTFFLEGGAS